MKECWIRLISSNFGDCSQGVLSEAREFLLLGAAMSHIEP